MGKYRYLNDKKTPHEFKSCEGCYKEDWIPTKNKYCSRECFYLHQDRSKRAPWGSLSGSRIDVSDKVSDYESKWHYIKADPERLKKHQERSSKDKRKVRQWLSEYKITRGCFDCGFNTHFAALQLDHTGIKTAQISDLRSSIPKLQQEIINGECVVRCANCHSIKTWCDKNGVDYDPADYL